jgi:hypothetical protein
MVVPGQRCVQPCLAVAFNTQLRLIIIGFNVKLPAGSEAYFLFVYPYNLQ